MAIYRLAIGPGGLSGPSVPRLQKSLTRRSASLSTVLASISQADAVEAQRAHRAAEIGTAGALALLLLVFMLFYIRSVRARSVVERLARQNDRLLYTSRQEATTDPLTGLGNRRALEADLGRRLREPSHQAELLLAIFDLDGFKQYNDSFGHAAGDVLLQRWARAWANWRTRRCRSTAWAAMSSACSRRCTPADAEALLAAAADALSDSGDEWQIGCSYGAAWIPSEAAGQSDALRLADQRMYANKRSRASARRQLTDVLLQVITEQDTELDAHVEHVAGLAIGVAERLGQAEHELELLRLAATLHDVGKTAIPTEILQKAGPLNAPEWEFMRRHTLIGERIVLAAPALAIAAPVVRASHEHWDGNGYPDGLTGEEIPLASRIIAVCDAFDAMTSARPYSEAMTEAAAFGELQRCSGTQFDPKIVDAFCAMLQAGAVVPPTPIAVD